MAWQTNAHKMQQGQLISWLQLPPCPAPHLCPAVRLVHHDAGVGQAAPLPRLPRRQQQGGHGSGLAHTQSADGAAHILHTTAVAHVSSLGGSHVAALLLSLEQLSTQVLYDSCWAGTPSGCWMVDIWHVPCGSTVRPYGSRHNGNRCMQLHDVHDASSISRRLVWHSQVVELLLPHLHGVVDGQAGCDHPTWAVDVHADLQQAPASVCVAPPSQHMCSTAALLCPLVVQHSLASLGAVTPGTAAVQPPHCWCCHLWGRSGR
jgi:hypothetical protein